MTRVQHPPAAPTTTQGSRARVALTREPLAVEELTAWATMPGCGAVVTFLGVVRDHADGRDGVFAMTYEAYEEPALRAMDDLVADVWRRWPSLGRIALVHRLGELALSESSVAVVVSAPHRAEAFEAARAVIDTLKQTVPIWKQEHRSEGSEWVPGTPIRPLHGAAPPVGD
jgi:molybdopterin synthase catalytic subunit